MLEVDKFMLTKYSDGNIFDLTITYKNSMFFYSGWFTKKYTNEISRKRLINKYGEPDREKNGYLIYTFMCNSYLKEV